MAKEKTPRDDGERSFEDRIVECSTEVACVAVIFHSPFPEISFYQCQLPKKEGLVWGALFLLSFAFWEVWVGEETTV